MTFLETVLAGLAVAAIVGLAGMAVRAPKLMRRLGGVVFVFAALLTLISSAFAIGVTAGAAGASPEAAFNLARWSFVAGMAVLGLTMLSLWIELWREQDRRANPPKP